MRLEKLTIRGLGPFREEATLDLTTIPHQIVAITGANGEGKSTLLELFPGALYRACPTRGSLASLATRRDAMVEATVVNGERFGVRQLVDAVSGKGETLLTDADGEAINASGKLREADGWIAKHIVPPEVLYASTFAHQGSGGFVDLKPADRKKVLLRILGIERLEALAEKAREKARAAREELRILLARIEDEEGRGVPLVQAEQRLDELKLRASAVNEAVAIAREELDRIRALREDLVEKARVYDEAIRRRSETGRRIHDLGGRHHELATRIANNRRVLERSDQIRAAVQRAAELDEILRRGDDAERERAQAIEVARQRLDMSVREVDILDRDEKELRRAVEAHQGVIDKWAEPIEKARELFPEMLRLEEEAQRERDASEAALAEVEGQRLADAEGRIEALRGGLESVLGADELEAAHATARESLDLDADAVAKAEQLPHDIAKAKARLADARAEVARIDAHVSEARATLEREPELSAAYEGLNDARSALDNIMAQKVTFEEAVSIAAEALRSAESQALPDVEEARRERSSLDELIKLRQPLEQAEARLAELEPQLRDVEAEIAKLEADLLELGEPDAPAEAPPLGPAEERVRTAEAEASEADRALVFAERDLETAQAVAARVAELSAQRTEIEIELSDWTRLAADLGKDGIQALEIDAAGPELTEFVNDLLRSCHGSRFTVSIETTKLSSDGKRQLEGCEVHVIDTVRGREGAAETFSGGERVIIGEAVSLALSVLACRRAGLERPTLVRDESGAALDATNGRAYMAMLRRAAEMIDADKVLFVSHTPELQELADARVIIESGQIRLEGATE